MVSRILLDKTPERVQDCPFGENPNKCGFRHVDCWCLERTKSMKLKRNGSFDFGKCPYCTNKLT